MEKRTLSFRKTFKKFYGLFKQVFSPCGKTRLTSSRFAFGPKRALLASLIFFCRKISTLASFTSFAPIVTHSVSERKAYILSAEHTQSYIGTTCAHFPPGSLIFSDLRFVIFELQYE